MSGLGIKVFNDGVTLTAAEINGYLMDQAVAVFEDTADRDNSFGGSGEPTLSEGRLCYLKSTKIVQYYNGSSWVDSEQFAVSINSQVSPGILQLDRLVDGTAGQIIVCDSTGTPTYVTLSGDATISSTGVLTIGGNTVTLGTDTTGNYVATIAGTTNQITVTGSGSETAAVTLALPQDIHTAANPTFAGLTADAVRIGITSTNEIDTTSGNLVLDSTGGTVTVDDILSVTGSAAISGAASIAGLLTAATNLSVTGSAAISGAASIAGLLTAATNLSVTGSATVSGAASIAGLLTAATNLSVTGSAAVSGAASIAGLLTAATNLSVTGSAAVSGAASIAGLLTAATNLSVTGSTAVSGAASIAGLLTAANNLSVTGSAAVSGAASIAGLLTGAAGLSLTGNATISGNAVYHIAVTTVPNGGSVTTAMDGQVVELGTTASAASTYYIPGTGWTVGSQITVIQMGTGSASVSFPGQALKGTPINPSGAASTVAILRTQFSSATLINRGTNDWFVIGDLKI